jgi:hypothetical protein
MHFVSRHIVGDWGECSSAESRYAVDSAFSFGFLPSCSFGLVLNLRKVAPTGQLKPSSHRAIVLCLAGFARQPVGFSSPWRTITINSVEDISDSAKLAAGGDGNYDLSVPLARLGWQPQPGQSYAVDLKLRSGLRVLRRDSQQTTQRVSGSNKPAAITAAACRAKPN